MIKDTSGQDTIIATRSRRWQGWVAAVGLLLIIGLTAVLYPSWRNWASAEHTIDRQMLRMSEVVAGDLTRDITAQGTIVAAIKPTLFSPASGVVNLLVQAGDRVKANDAIAILESPELRNLLDQERAALESAETGYKRQQIQSKKIQLQNQQVTDLAEVSLSAANRELRRAVAAHDQEAISEFDFDKARDDVALAELRHRHAQEDGRLQAESLAFELQTTQLNINQQKFRVTELERQVEELSITSPVTGIVGNLLVEHKDAVSKNQALVTVVDLTAFEVELQVPDSYARGLAPGLEVEVSHQGQHYAGRLTSVSPEVQNSQLTARVAFDGSPPATLRQNQRVSGRIMLDAKQNVLIVERGPFLESSGGRFTYVVDGNLARRQMIETGLTSVASVEVTAGLTAGQLVVISSLTDFKDAEVVYLSN